MTPTPPSPSKISQLDPNSSFTEISPFKLTQNFFSRIHHDSFLITAGTTKKYNMMTAGWGGIGILWEMPVVYLFVRPSRYTYDFLETHSFCSLNFFPSSFRKTVNLCGTKSGREIDKMHIEGLSTTEFIASIEEENENEYKNNATVYFNEADLVIISEKIYYQDLDEDIIPPTLKQKFYLKGDFHRQYIGKITKVFQK